MHDGVNLFAGQQIVDNVGAANVGLDKLEVGQAHDIGHVLDRRAIIDLV